MNEEVRVYAEDKDTTWILTGITDNSEYAFRDFINNGNLRAKEALENKTATPDGAASDN